MATFFNTGPAVPKQYAVSVEPNEHVVDVTTAEGFRIRFVASATNESSRGPRSTEPPANGQVRRVATPEAAATATSKANVGPTRQMWLALAAMLFLTGCSSFRTEMGRPLAPEKSKLAEGKTQVEDVVSELGPPNLASRLPDGFAFLYEYSRISEFQLGLSLNLPVVRWFKFLKAWNNIQQESLLLTFDERGVLRSAGSGSWKEGLGGGTGVQILFQVMSFSDVSEFLRPREPLGWGDRLLQPLPVALNNDQSLRTGEHGLQQRIAPDYAGQHTLEMTKPKTEKERRKLKKEYQWQSQQHM